MPTVMHGTFPRRIDKERGKARAASLWSGVAFAALPLIIVLLVALMKCGREVTLPNVVEVLYTATTAASL
jgi:hypothetical protein